MVNSMHCMAGSIRFSCDMFALSSLLWAGHLFIFCYHYCIVAILVAMCKMMVNQFSFLPSL